MTAPNFERILIHADGQTFCLACADMLYDYRVHCSGCGRHALNGTGAIGARHGRCEAGGRFKALDDAHDEIRREVVPATLEEAPVCQVCDEPVGGQG